MIVSTGKSILLSAKVNENNLPLTGKVVTAQIVQAEDAVEVFAQTVIPETSELGLYALDTALILSSQIDLIALWTINGLIYSEEINIRAFGSGGSTALTLKFEQVQAITLVFKSNQLTMAFDTVDSLSLEMENSNEMNLNFESQELTLIFKEC